MDASEPDALQALLERAEALQKELAVLDEEHAADDARIAELEKQLRELEP